MQQQSHLIQTPSGAFKGHLRAASHISVQCISCMVWKKDETYNLVLGDYTYVLSHTHRLLFVSPSLTHINPPHCCCASPSYFCWPVCAEVDRGEHTISRRPNTENWITPGLTSLGATPTPICTPCCQGGPFRGGRWPLLGPRARGASASAAGQHDNLYKALSNTWLTRPPPILTNTDTRADKLPQKPDRQPNPGSLFALLSSSIC